MVCFNFSTEQVGGGLKAVGLTCHGALEMSLRSHRENRVVPNHFQLISKLKLNEMHQFSFLQTLET